jgi:hypothetical protein
MWGSDGRQHVEKDIHLLHGQVALCPHVVPLEHFLVLQHQRRIPRTMPRGYSLGDILAVVLCSAKDLSSGHIADEP